MKLITGLAFLALAFTPFIWNGVKLANCDFEAPYKCEAIHVIGVIIPPSAFITVWFADDSEA